MNFGGRRGESLQQRLRGDQRIAAVVAFADQHEDGRVRRKGADLQKIAHRRRGHGRPASRMAAHSLISSPPKNAASNVRAASQLRIARQLATLMAVRVSRATAPGGGTVAGPRFSRAAELIARHVS